MDFKALLTTDVNLRLCMTSISLDSKAIHSSSREIYSFQPVRNRRDGKENGKTLTHLQLHQTQRL